VDALVHQLLAFLAREGEKIQNGSWMHSGDSGSSANRATLYQVLQNAHSLSFGQDHVTERPWLYFYERLLALWAAIPLLTLPVLPKLLSWHVAGLAVHFISPREQHNSIHSRKHCQVKNSSNIFHGLGDIVG
jgi:hypothetical protein